MSTSKGSGGVQPVPASARKIVQSLKEVVNCSVTEIYATLKDCNMDPDETVSRLLSQDPFHEVKSKREKKKEGKDTNEYRPRGANSSPTRGGKSGAEPYLGRGGSTPYYSSESGLIQGKYIYKKKTEATPYTSSLPSAPSISGNNINRGTTGLSDHTSAENKGPSLVGGPGQLSMADIVKMGRPHNKVANAQKGSHNNDCTSRFPDNIASKVHDERPSVEKPVASVLESIPEITVDSHMPPEDLVMRFDSEYQDYEAKNDEETVENQDYVGSHSISSRKFPNDDSRRGSQYENDLHKNMGSSYLPQEHDFERHEVEVYGASVSSVTRKMQQSVESDERGLPSDGDADAPLIIQFPDHLKVSADFSKLSFGNFHAGMTIPYSSSGAVTSLPVETSLEEQHTEVDIPSVSHSDTRELEYFGDGSFRNAAGGSLYRRTGSSDESSASQLKPPENADEVQYHFPPSDFGYSYDPRLLNAAISQRNSEMQNLSPFSNDMHQSYPGSSLPSTLLAANVQPKPSRESELEYYSRFNITPEMAARYGVPASAIGGSVTSMFEVPKTPGLPSMQPAPHNLSRPSGPTGGPPLQQHLAVHPYSEPALPSDPYASMIGGYPSLPQSYTYMPSAFQQTMANNSQYHQSLAAALPSRYKSRASVINVPHSADIASRYGYGGLRNEGTISGKFSMKPPNTLSGRSLNYDDVLSSQYKDSLLISLQQNENSSMWPHDQGPISRTMSAVPSSTYYDYLGQSQLPGGFRQRRQTSPNYGLEGYPNYYHSQPGMAQDQQEIPRYRSQDGSQGQPRQYY